MAALALVFNLFAPFALPVAPVVALGSVQTAVICTAQGFQVIALDADGQPLPASPPADLQCLFCLPLLKQGGAAPTTAPEIVPIVAAPTAVTLPAITIYPRRLQARLIAAPRAPPLA